VFTDEAARRGNFGLTQNEMPKFLTVYGRGQETVKRKRAETYRRDVLVPVFTAASNPCLPSAFLPAISTIARATLSLLTGTLLSSPDFPFHCTFDKRLRHRRTPIPWLRNRAV